MYLDIHIHLNQHNTQIRQASSFLSKQAVSSASKQFPQQASSFLSKQAVSSASYIKQSQSSKKESSQSSFKRDFHSGATGQAQLMAVGSLGHATSPLHQCWCHSKAGGPKALLNGYLAK